jgi:hypothetical protein
MPETEVSGDSGNSGQENSNRVFMVLFSPLYKLSCVILGSGNYLMKFNK